MRTMSQAKLGLCRSLFGLKSSERLAEVCSDAEDSFTDVVDRGGLHDPSLQELTKSREMWEIGVAHTSLLETLTLPMLTCFSATWNFLTVRLR